jgi:hypothetical protein
LIIKAPLKLSVFAYKYGYARTTSYEYVFDKPEDQPIDDVCEDSSDLAEINEKAIRTEEHPSPKNAHRKGSMPGTEQKNKAPREVNLMMHLTNEAVQVKSKYNRAVFYQKDKNSFGKFEQGNKVYYNELEDYFKDDPAFTSKNASFKQHVLPEIRVSLGANY